MADFWFDLTGGKRVRLDQAAPIMVGVDATQNPRAVKVTPTGELVVAGGDFQVPAHDYKELAYFDAGKTNISTVKFRRGGSTGTIVATMTLTYSGDPTAIANAPLVGVALT